MIRSWQRCSQTKKALTQYSFNSEIRAGEMTFDYVLARGIYTDFNASELMKKSGIKIRSFPGI
jgi:hypothetical protein